MKILFAFYAATPGIEAGYTEIASCAPPGIEVHCFNLNLPYRKSKLNWEQLDPLWRKREPGLLEMYDRLAAAASDCDVLLVYNGRNVHPEFARSLSTFNIFTCFDDPESSEKLSFPVAAGFDAVFYGNISSASQYESWGCTRKAFLPIFVSPSKIPERKDGDKVLTSSRANDIVIVCGRNSKRRRRLDMLIHAFPHAKAYGKNWNRGWIDDCELRRLYLNSRVGWNIHNSTGPINVRLYMLAAYGILPVCDNKTGLGMLFNLGKEAVGADTIPEMIEATRYYLEHEDERRLIAEGAYRRFWSEYHPAAIWQKIANHANEWCPGQTKQLQRPLTEINSIKNRNKPQILSRLADKGQRFKDKVRTRISPVMFRGGANVQPWYDESLYLGINTPLNTIGPARHYKKPRPLGDQLDFQSHAHNLARLWAMTALLTNETSLLSKGRDAYIFSRLAAVDPARTAHCHCTHRTDQNLPATPPDFGNLSFIDSFETSGTYDAIILTDIYTSMKKLTTLIVAVSNSTNRLLFSFRLGGPQDNLPHQLEPHELMHSLDTTCSEIELFYMPDIYVPWLEPLTTTSQSSLVVGRCNTINMI